MSQLSLLDGAALRSEALDRLTQKYGAVARQLHEAMVRLWTSRARRDGGVGLADYHIAGNDRMVPIVSGDDAADWLDAVGFTGERRLTGAVFGSRMGWRCVGYRRSRIARRHARPVALWEWVGRPEKVVTGAEVR